MQKRLQRIAALVLKEATQLLRDRRTLMMVFGLPLIEAMQQGCPIVCGKHSSLPEIAGEAALYTDVASSDELASSILAITRDEALRNRLKQSGTENLRRFDRRALAEKTRAIYASVHDQHFA